MLVSRGLRRQREIFPLSLRPVKPRGDHVQCRQQHVTPAKAYIIPVAEHASRVVRVRLRSLRSFYVCREGIGSLDLIFSRYQLSASLLVLFPSGFLLVLQTLFKRPAQRRRLQAQLQTRKEALVHFWLLAQGTREALTIHFHADLE